MGVGGKTSNGLTSKSAYARMLDDACALLSYEETYSKIQIFSKVPNSPYEKKIIGNACKQANLPYFNKLYANYLITGNIIPKTKIKL